MRFMVLVKADRESESGALPDERLLVEMGKFNEELISAGVMLAGEGLHPSSKGARIKFSGKGKTAVTNGPFPLTGDLLAGYWLVQANSKQEAIDLFKRAPFEHGEIELRQVFEPEDFAPAVKTSEGRATLQAEQQFRDRSKH
jgi:hypothetical protein